MKKGKRSEYGQKTKVRNHGKRLNEHISVRALEKEYNADRSKICHWLRDYGQYGEEAFNYRE